MTQSAISPGLPSPSSPGITIKELKLKPTLPFEIQRRIIHFRLALTPSYPSQLEASAPITPAWDDQAGQIGRQAVARRMIERGETQDAALDLMRVCKAWKTLIMRYLYAEPSLHASNLLTFTSALIKGDRKWSDLNLHPHSLPGRYITTLDLSHLDGDYPYLHVTAVDRALRDIFPLVPNLRHLILPSRSPVRSEDIWRAPFAKSLRALEGVQVDYLAPIDPSGRDELVVLLRHLPHLEVLSLLGPGGSFDSLPWEGNEQPLLDLPKLHTLTMNGIKTGLLLHTLIQSDLPALRRLILTSYNGIPDDQTHAFQVSHGHKLLSLTYLASREWPTSQAIPPIETLSLHPYLLHLAFCLPNTILQSNPQLVQGLTAQIYRNHPLQAITIPKWTEMRHHSPSPSPGPSPAPTPHPLPTTHTATPSTYFSLPTSRMPNRDRNRFLRTLIRHPPQHLRQITIDGYRWARPDLGRKALETGSSGTMRDWAVELAERGLEMRDMDGKCMPSLNTGIDPNSNFNQHFGSLSLNVTGGDRGRRWDRRSSGGMGGMSLGVRVKDRGHEDGS